ncbi:hypothetical protein NOF04DRAFT_1343217 [Fusarium oxysporum II5]|uniref:DUF4048 domain-containing protein n=4 Tax=Fusarium oxysporum species complex TaxID=171631 RepID=N1RIL5_FUSC4|nr:hypothetical protein FOC4_g10011339 [Fusarium odoratissimum]KAK2131301.1 hypothetical protein NOF04DRAFT_1343217 [Fusarium oxysporum II5]TXC09797.1 hypothetical protein FocTR4_00005169 [Fusarium oxysporum f. sp. cubense]
MASQQQAIRRRYSVADRLPADLVLPTTPSNSNFETAPSSTISATASPTVGVAASVNPRYAPVRDLAQGSNPRHLNSSSHNRHGSMTSTAAMPSRPASKDESVPFRRGHARAKSSVSSMNRQVNRLSLTLPIAPPTSDPSRPTPTSASMSSVPPTPIESGIATPADANEFIIAIAAQERRVLELREELSRAEADLTLLKKKWTAQEKKGDTIPLEAFRSPILSSEDDAASIRRSVDSDRRKLLQQTQNPATPNRRRVLRGGHTRTLSLLSPAKPDAGFSLYQDRDHEHEQVKLPSIERRTAQLTNPHLSKRASWQPRTQQNGPAVPQIVEDFKLGLRAFVEDIRQITVGDEPINGQPIRSNSVNERGEANRNQDTIRPNRPLRPKVSTVFEPPHNNSDTTETKSSTSTSTASKRPELPARSKTKSKNKSFSWQPLGFDSMDDNDWSNWESPASSSKTSRWSGSTIGSGGLDDMSATSDEGEPADSPSKKKSTGYETPLLSPKLEELLPNIVNQFSPSNIKRTATTLMDEWEKSLTDPNYPHQTQNKENTA